MRYRRLAEALPNSIRTSPEVQGRPDWTPPGGTLGRILGSTRARVTALSPEASELRDRAQSAPAVPSLLLALQQDPNVALIAEVKRRSPSRGAINESLDPASLALAFQRAGAAAVSILTEPHSFGGHVSDLRNAARLLGIPILRKDFCIDPLQVLESRAHGASAVLLIMRALAPGQAQELADCARMCGLDVLAEARSESELEVALGIPGAILGVNNRNLETLEIDQSVGARLIPRIPLSRVAVFESGVSARADVEQAASAGADAVLVGSALSGAPDPTEKVRSLLGVPRSRRARSD